jgi:hypothetical protein
MRRVDLIKKCIEIAKKKYGDGAFGYAVAKVWMKDKSEIEKGNFGLNFYKVGVVKGGFKKSVGGRERWIIDILCSDTKIDLQGERVDIEFLKKMAEQAKNGEVLLLLHHGDSIEVGKSVDSEITPNEELIISFELNPEHPYASFIMNEVEKGSKRQASIGGIVTEDYYETVDGGATVVRVLKDGILKHVALTLPGEAANPRTRILD